MIILADARLRSRPPQRLFSSPHPIPLRPPYEAAFLFGIRIEMKKKYTSEGLAKLPALDPALVNNVDISKEGFRKNFREAIRRAYECAKRYVFNNLDLPFRFRVKLGASYDGNPLVSDETTFPEDYTERERCFSEPDQVTDLLWREGKVPEWINVSIKQVDASHVFFEVLCCGRYSTDKEMLYHHREGIVPFHVLGPPLPTDYVFEDKIEKFDLNGG